jgi:hypothetical protein
MQVLSVRSARIRIGGACLADTETKKAIIEIAEPGESLAQCLDTDPRH